MKIGIASDHGGYNLKKELIFALKERNYEVLDYGTYSEESTDYPVYAFKVCDGVIDKNVDFGIAICRTGIGMSIACNKVDGIRCAKIDNNNDAKCAKNHNNANVISFSADKSLKESLEMIEIFIDTEVSNEERHIRRVKLIKDYENEH